MVLEPGVFVLLAVLSLQIRYVLLVFQSQSCLPVPVVMTCLLAEALFDLFACPDSLHTAGCKPACRQVKGCFHYICFLSLLFVSSHEGLLVAVCTSQISTFSYRPGPRSSTIQPFVRHWPTSNSYLTNILLIFTPQSTLPTAPPAQTGAPVLTLLAVWSRR